MTTPHLVLPDDPSDLLGWDPALHGRMLEHAAPDDAVATEEAADGAPRPRGAPDLVGALRARGLRVEVVPGHESRTAGSVAPVRRGVTDHWTAGPATGDRPSLRVCVEGRPGLPGPLCNVFLARSGVAVVVALGRANHAGAGGFRGLVGNSSVWGVEAESDGRGWTQEQRWAYPRVNAAFCDLGADPDLVHGHHEWAQPAGRKLDIRDWTMVQMREQTRAVLAGSSAELGPRLLSLTSPLTRGEDVRQLQQLLAARGHLPAAGVDGAFGRDTDRALRAAQEALGLRVDGVAGPLTLAALARPADPTDMLVGAVRDRWLSLPPEVRELLGPPTGPEQGCPDGVGRYSHLHGGSIYWHPELGAHAVYGAVRAGWERMGWEAGRMGYPVSEEADHAGPDGAAGRGQHFQTGALVWLRASGEVLEVRRIL